MLPVLKVIEPLKAALRQGSGAVLVAEPGAGKTTAAPLELLKEPWADGGKILLLEPRRLAARMAAARMAASLGESVGDTIGLRVRLQSLTSAKTRLEVVTEGVFTRMILEDPGLEGVRLVIFDEFHERSLDADLGLALARHTQTVLRDDLKILVMSATLDGARVGALIGGAPVITSRGRAHPVRTEYLGRRAGASVDAEAERAVRQALGAEPGGVLVFLPGQAEIVRTEARLRERLPPDVDLAPLYAALDLRTQDRAVLPAPPGRRKVVLATSIAETSLTLEGVRVVVDCGLARGPAYDPASGLTRLRTFKVSRAAADQRRGRAGRTEPGVCYRLWEEEETRALPAFAPPEIATSELSGFLLSLLVYGAPDPAELALLDQPPKGALGEARNVLRRLGALGADDRLTDVGRALGDLPLPPRLGRVLIEGVRRDAAERAAALAAVLSERGLGGAFADLGRRASSFLSAKDPRAREARRLADAWARAGRAASRSLKDPHDVCGPVTDGGLLIAGFPERLARRRGPGEYQLITGRSALLEPEVGDPGWVVAAELAGETPKDRIRLAAVIEEEEALEHLAPSAERLETLEPGPGGALRVRRILRAGAFVLEERFAEADAEARVRALIEEVRASGLRSLPLSPRTASLLERWTFLRKEEEPGEDGTEELLLEGLERWLAPVLHGARRLADAPPAELHRALEAELGPGVLERLGRLAPETFRTPVGSDHPIDYAAEGGPRVEVRVQELFGLDAHPTVGARRRPLVLALTSPARRPIQVTRDLPGFWRGSWAEVRREMRGRYPRHPWPENPLEAAPTTRAKPRGT